MPVTSTSQTSKPAAFNYDSWVTEQAAKIEAALRAAFPRGVRGWPEVAAWIVPSSRVPRGEPSDTCTSAIPVPLMGLDIVRLGPHGSTLARCPYSHIRSLLWDAAKSSHSDPADRGANSA